ncbi:MAG: M20 family metallopeptidase, partial [Bacteroidota bacterium]
MSLKNQIQDFATEIFDSVITQRRHIHAHPELSFEEKETAAFVNQRLQQLGIETETDIAGHGLVGYIRGTKTAPEGVASKVLALRADMDALPIVEENEVPYRSQNQGVMHACGHDVHTSSLLGTAQVLQHFREHFSGTIKLIFQPAEERAPGGASLMIQEGVLKQPQPVNGILGQHVQPYFPCGKIGVRSGIYMASADEIYLEIKGKGGHAAHPAHFIDPVMITAQMLVALQQVVSRSDPRIPSVLSFGKINSDGGATN